MQQNLLWPTPLWIYDLEIDPTPIIERLHLLRNQNPEIQHKSNKGPTNWQSHPDLFKEQELVPLCDQIYFKCKEIFDVKDIFFEQMWGQISYKNDYNNLHSHSNKFDLTGVYYPLAPSDGPCIRFRDPRPAGIANNFFKTHFDNGEWKLFQPKTNSMYLFPSFLEHAVDISQSNSERIVISFDINLEK